MSSIRKRLLFLLLVAELLAGVFAVWSAFAATQSEFDSLCDSALETLARSVAHRGNVSPASITLAGNDPKLGIVLQIYESDGNALFLSDPSRAFPIPGEMGFSEVKLGNETWRVYTVTSGREIIKTGQSGSVRTNLAAGAALRIVRPFLFVLPVLALFVWLIVGQGLAPLDRTARAIASRSPSNLKQIPAEGLPAELRTLVTSVNSLMKRLSESLEAQKRFASDAAHELRTPLTAIKLQAQLASKAKTEELRNKSLGRLGEGVERAARLIGQLLLIARLDPEATARPFEKLDAAAILGSVVRDLEPVAAAKSIAVSADAPAGIAFPGMRDAVLLMMTNLADNAIKYTPEGGTVTLSAREEAGFVRLSVRDTGPGIPEDARNRVFERFYRVPGTGVQGNGLGLAIVRRIAEIHGGTAEAGAAPDGRGAVFTVRLKT